MLDEGHLPRGLLLLPMGRLADPAAHCALMNLSPGAYQRFNNLRVSFFVFVNCAPKSLA